VDHVLVATEMWKTFPLIRLSIDTPLFSSVGTAHVRLCDVIVSGRLQPPTGSVWRVFGFEKERTPANPVYRQDSVKP